MFKVMILVFMLSSCVAAEQNRDRTADFRLGVNRVEDHRDVDDALLNTKKMNFQEYKKNLQRDITDPAASADATI